MSEEYPKQFLEDAINEADGSHEASRRGPSARELGGMFLVAISTGAVAGYGLPPVVNGAFESLKPKNAVNIVVEQQDTDPQRVIVVVRHDVEATHP